MLQIRSLVGVSPAQITECFNGGFSDYEVKIQATEDYLFNRWASSQLDLSLSAGAWDGDQLVGMVVIMCRESEDIKMAFNATTCVLPKARGQALTQRIFDFILPKFKAVGVKKASLEVLENNQRAIHIYEKIGFKIQRKLFCFKATDAPLPFPENITIQACKPLKEFPKSYQTNLPAWEQKTASIRYGADKHQWYCAVNEGENVAWAIVNPYTNWVSQILIKSEYRLQDFGNALFSYLRHEKLPVRFLNVDENAPLREYFTTNKFDNIINQFEMWWDLP